jgi:hypothetical protein
MAGSRKSGGTDPVDLCKAVAGRLRGEPGPYKGGKLTCRGAEQTYSGVCMPTNSRWCQHSAVNGPFHRAVLDLDFDALTHGQEQEDYLLSVSVFPWKTLPTLDSQL